MAAQWKDFDPYYDFMLWPDTLWSRDCVNYDHTEAFCRTRQTRYDPDDRLAISFMSCQYKVNGRSTVIEGPISVQREPREPAPLRGQAHRIHQWLRGEHWYQDYIARRMRRRFPLLFV